MDMIERVARAVLTIRGHKVLLDNELALLYGVPPKALKQAVRRNLDRFPEDFMFRLTWEEWREILRSQSVTLRFGHGTHPKYLPYAFTEQGVAMLSSVLRSPRALLVNIQIMRAFVALRRLLVSHADLARKIDDIERKYDSQFKVVFDALRELMEEDPPKDPIGFSKS